MFLLALLGRLKWVALVALLVAAAWGYWMWSRAELTALHAQVAAVQAQAVALQAANLAIQTDIRAVQNALAHANDTIAQVRVESSRQVQAIRSRSLNQAARSNPVQVQQQINDDTNNALRGLEAASKP